MRVILLQDIKGLGKKLEVKEVSNGYARNFLLPHKLAQAATSGALRQRAKDQRQAREEIVAFQKMAKKIKNEVLEFKIKTGEKGAIFSSVSKEDIEAALKKKGYKDFGVELTQPLRAIGTQRLGVKFPHGTKSEVTIILQPQQP